MFGYAKSTLLCSRPVDCIQTLALKREAHLQSSGRTHLKPLLLCLHTACHNYTIKNSPPSARYYASTCEIHGDLPVMGNDPHPKKPNVQCYIAA